MEVNLLNVAIFADNIYHVQIQYILMIYFLSGVIFVGKSAC